jgi:molybdenum cofactor guanylyltransferase
MQTSAGVVLVGGRSSRMGSAKAALEWHGSTLLWRTVCVLGRATGGPVVVVRARSQELPAVPPGTAVVADRLEGRGPVQGIATGLEALAGKADVAFVAATDLPFLHPEFVRQVVRAALAGPDVALPAVRGFRQPLAAAYRTSLAPLVGRLVAAGLLRPAQLFAECEVAVLDQAALLAHPVLAAVDPDLDSVLNVNDPADYDAARARPAAEVTVRVSRSAQPPSMVGEPAGLKAAAGHHERRGGQLVRAATLAEAAGASGVAFGRDTTVSVNGEAMTGDGQMPLVAGDTVVFHIGAAGAD